MQVDKKSSITIIGRRMRERREALGLAQEKIGVAIGLDESSARARISRYELGVHEPPVPTAKLIARALKVPMIYLYCEDDSTAKLLLELYKIGAKDRATLVQKFLSTLTSVSNASVKS